MANTAYYNTGTATVAANSKTVTGTGTNWLSAVGGLTAIKAGDKFGIHVGRPIIIASVDSNTQLTLEDNWPGPAQTNAAYKIELTNPDVIAVEAMRRLLGSLGSGVLYGLSQLPSTPSRLLGIDENGLAALLATIPNAQLPTRLRELSTAVTDANSAVTNGTYGVASTAANIPVTATGSLVVMTFNATNLVQFYTRVSNGDIWVRNMGGGAWGTWVRLATLDSSGLVADALLPARLKATATVVTDDLDIDRDSGWYVANSPALNRPNNTDGYFWHIRNTANFQSQIFITSAATPVMYRRTKRSGVWGGWKNVDGDVSGPGTAVTSRSIAGFAGTSGQSISQLTVLEGLAALGPVFGGVSPVPSAAGVGLSDGDFNTLTVGGLYTITGSWASGPKGNPATHAGQVEIEARYSTGLTQIFRDFIGGNQGAAYKRVGYRSTASDPWTWTAWARIEAEDTAASLALSALTPAADRLPYFNGASSAALATLTSFGRTLLDDADAAAAWATLGAGQSLAANGWQRLPSGLILQWGSATTNGGNLTVAFPTAFPNACFGVFANVNLAQPAATVMYSAWADTWTLSNFVLRTRYVAGGTVASENMPASYWAVGR